MRGKALYIFAYKNYKLNTKNRKKFSVGADLVSAHKILGLICGKNSNYK